MMFHAIDWLYSISGFAIGMLVGVTGVGGGALMTPVLILLFGIHPVTAVGTDLLYAAATKTVGTFVHGLSHTIEWRVVGRLAAGSVPMTAASLFLLSRFDLEDSGVQAAITGVLSAALFGTAGVLIFRRRIQVLYARHIGEIEPRRTTQLTVAIGALLGLVVSISSVGAGAIGVTALVLLYPKLPMARIVGSDIAHAVPLTLAAGLGHWMIGSIDGGLLASLLVGSVPGVILGSYLSTRVPDGVLRFTLATTLIIAGGKLAF
jgi:uncharacterized protein